MAGTLNNPTEDEKKHFLQVKCKKMIAGMEVGEEGTPHIQFAVVWDTAKSFKAAKEILSDRCHIETARKGWLANWNYCRKEGQVLRDWDGSVGQGKRTDIHDALEDVKKRKSMEDMLDDHTSVVAKYPKFIDKCREVYDKKKASTFREVEVIVHWGEAGTGKSRPAFEDGAYAVASYSPEWWDGYDGETVVLFDDFYGQLKLCRMLRLLDGYPVQCPVKGGFRYLLATKIYITSNSPPEDWYGGCPEKAKAGLMRRITKVIKFD